MVGQPTDSREEIGRIISARKATRYERAAYAEEYFELPPQVRDQVRALADKPESEINTDDVPEALDWSNASRGVFYRPVKQQITLRLDSDVVA